MRRSEKLLLAILVLGLLGWQGWRLINRLVVDPIRRSQAELERLDKQIAEQERQVTQMSAAEHVLAKWQARSLPPDPLTAQRLYQQWLTDLAQGCDFDALNVYPDRVTAKSDTCVGVQVAIVGEARLDQLCLFLRRFYRTALTHRITTLNIDSTQDQGDPILRVTIMAEGLALQGAESRKRLFPTTGTLGDDLDAEETTAQVLGVGTFTDQAFLMRIGAEFLDWARVTETEWTVKRGAHQSLPRSHPRGAMVEFIPQVSRWEPPYTSDYTELVAQNPFAKPTPKVVAQAPPPKDEPAEIDPAEFTYLVAAFSQDDQRQAWLYDRLNNQTVVITPGKPFVVGGFEGLVHAIGDDFVLLEYAQARWRLQLGKNLRAMERLAEGADK